MDAPEDGAEKSEGGAGQSIPANHRGGKQPTKRGAHRSTVVAVVLAVVLLVLATILVLNHGTLPLGQTSTPAGNPVLIFIDGIHRVISYKGNISGDFGPGVNDSCPFCPVGAQAGGAIRIPLATWNPPWNLSFWAFT